MTKSAYDGSDMYKLMKKLYPICRSITGNGVRQTLKIISEYIPLSIHEVPTGKKMFDWVIPKEWNIKDAYVLDPNGKKIIDFQKSNLHILNYSIPVHKKISLTELKEHLYTLPDKPDLIPYMTSYYNENWGFCMTHNDFLKLKDGEYEVVINSTLENGSLTYGEYFLKGKSDNEILISCYVCHPSLCNDNLSGIVMTTFLAKFFQELQTNYSIRFLFIPETIGAITWLSINENNLSAIKHGLVATCLGDYSTFTYKKSRIENSEIDNTVIKVLEESNLKFKIIDFFPYGSDERQFCSPGINLPVGSLFRAQYASSEFPEYHTSGDNLEFINQNSLKDSLSKYIEIISRLEKNFTKPKQLKKTQKTKNFTKNTITKKFLEHDEWYMNLNPKCEPHLSQRGLYNVIGNTVTHSSGGVDVVNQYALLWVLNFSDGKHSLYDIAQISKYDISIIKQAAHILEAKNLLKNISDLK